MKKSQLSRKEIVTTSDYMRETQENKVITNVHETMY